MTYWINRNRIWHNALCKDLVNHVSICVSYFMFQINVTPLIPWSCGCCLHLSTLSCCFLSLQGFLSLLPDSLDNSASKVKVKRQKTQAIQIVGHKKFKQLVSAAFGGAHEQFSLDKQSFVNNETRVYSANANLSEHETFLPLRKRIAPFTLSLLMLLYLYSHHLHALRNQNDYLAVLFSLETSGDVGYQRNPQS